ncbi:MAG: hypothetical protein E3J43_09390 [Candidatus Heimdallarchaeota archaeon]|nr:MAG: hypothetical protein E3J43_09390 [Candidatus Heimdallarchaeota archaeon]
MSEEGDIKTLAKLEVLSFEEAKLIFEQRQDLPLTAFCGPSCSYPSHDVECIRESFSRLMKHKPVGWEKIAKCIQEKADRFEINLGFHEASEEDKEKIKKITDWYFKKIQKKEEECEECDEE